MRAVKAHTSERWVVLYPQRWPQVPVLLPDGTLEPRDRGTPQGGVISPLLANLFLHYAFDAWMRRNHPAIAFERYADDVICHCRSQHEAHRLWEALRARFESRGLQLHPDKTHVVYCRDSNRRAPFADAKFTFLGFAFRPRMSRNSRGVIYTGFCQQ